MGRLLSEQGSRAEQGWGRTEQENGVGQPRAAKVQKY